MTTTLTYLSTYDPTTQVGQVRRAIQDVDVDTTPPDSFTPRDQWSCLFVDQEITLYVAMHADKVNATDLAAADLLDDVASSNALVARLIRLGDYESDTRTTAKILTDRAVALRNRWSIAQAAGATEPAEFIEEEVWDDFGYRRDLFIGK